MAMIAGARAGRGVRAPMLPTPATPSYQGAACSGPAAVRDWQKGPIDDPIHQRFLANTYCTHCPIADFCLTQAIERGEVTGVWGGLVAKELEQAREIARPKKPGTTKKAPVPATAESEPMVLGVAA